MTAPERPCGTCGIPTASKWGHCDRTLKCRAARQRAKYRGAEIGKCPRCGAVLADGETCIASPDCVDCAVRLIYQGRP